MISFGITTHNEGKNIGKLIERISKYKKIDDEIVVLDDFSTDETTLKEISKADRVIKHKFQKNYANHKNVLNTHCKKDYIFQLDGDELPTELLIKNIHRIILEKNKEIIIFPRVNKVTGTNANELRERGWKVDKFNRINYPDYQGRCYLNRHDIKWTRPLHEYIIGPKSSHVIAPNQNLDIIHIKTHEKQILSEQRYNEHYTKDYQIK